MNRDIRVREGQLQFRRYAYLHKKDRSKLGLLEAASHANAVEHLGRGYWIRTVWLTNDQRFQELYEDGRKKIVRSVMKDHLNTDP